MDQQHNDQMDGTNAAAMTGLMDANGMPQYDQQQQAAAFMNQQFDPNAMAGMMPGQPFMPDPSMGTMPMDASMMMPYMLSNGNGVGLQIPQNNISEDEIALYDRQIRLWGMAAQAKIRNANVLLIKIQALANEVAKNLVLAGIGSLTILDDAVVTESDLGSQFFLSESDVGQNRAQAASAAMQKLNPRVVVHVDAEGVKSKGPSYFGSFDVVIATDLDPDSYNLINTATRLNSRPFYAAGTHGMYGFIFSDLIEHSYVIERDQGNVATQPQQETRTRSIIDVKTKKEGPKTIESVTKRELYSTWFLASDLAGLPEEYTKSKRRLKSVSPALSCLRALWEFMQIQGGRLPGNREDLKLFTQIATRKHKGLGLPGETLTPEFLRSFLQNLGSEIAPVAAILGGQLAQDVINVLGQTQQPIQNTVIFDGNTMEALMYPLHPEGVIGASLLSMGGTDANANGGGMMMGADMTGMGMGMGGMGAGMMSADAMGMGSMPSDSSGMGAMPMADPTMATNGSNGVDHGTAGASQMPPPPAEPMAAQDETAPTEAPAQESAPAATAQSEAAAAAAASTDGDQNPSSGGAEKEAHAAAATEGAKDAEEAKS